MIWNARTRYKFEVINCYGPEVVEFIKPLNAGFKRASEVEEEFKHGGERGRCIIKIYSLQNNDRLNTDEMYTKLVHHLRDQKYDKVVAARRRRHPWRH